MKKIKAIETKYKGYRFRSRLEARWAVYFDSLGVDWEYEPEGFVLPNGEWYLPDFYIRNFDSWVEIKPASGDKEEMWQLLVSMQEAGIAKNGKSWGLIGDPLDHEWIFPVKDKSGKYVRDLVGAALEIYEHDGEFFSSGTFSLSHMKEFKAKNPNMSNLSLEEVVLDYEHKVKARSARFEHGETP